MSKQSILVLRLLKSYQTDTGLSFDYGTHFLRDTGIKELDELLFGDYIENLQVLGNLKGGGYHASQYNDQTAFLDSRTLPEEVYNKGVIQFLESCENNEPYKNIVAINAGAAIYLSGKAKDLKEGFALAHKVIDEGITKDFVYSVTNG